MKTPTLPRKPVSAPASRAGSGSTTTCLFTNTRALRPADLQRYAEEVDLDPVLFAECLESGRHADGVDADLESGQRHGVSGTPAFFVNGRLLSGAQPFANFQQIIDEELESAGGL